MKWLRTAIFSPAWNTRRANSTSPNGSTQSRFWYHAKQVTIAPLQIGPVSLATNLLLAPIAGYCDVSFRLVARSCGGVGLACTDLLCPEGVLRENRRSMELAATCPADQPLAMQLYGGDVDKLCDAARWAE